jgi:hypothetical protein
LSRRRMIWAYEDGWRVTMVCTDRAQHRQVKVGELRWFNIRAGIDEDGHEFFDRRPAQAFGRHGQLLRGTLIFPCVRCQRELRLSSGRASGMAREAKMSRISRIDISLLA